MKLHESKNSIYLVCEYIPGESLNSVLEKSKEFLSYEEIKQIAKGILLALAYLETTGIVHRDIKPDNIMIMNGCLTAESVKICDFGFGDFVDRQGPVFTKCGTPGYLAPECLGPVDSDEYFERTTSNRS